MKRFSLKVYRWITKLFFRKIDLSNLEEVERFFSLSLSSQPKKFKKEIKGLYEYVGDEKAWLFSKNERSESIIYYSLKKIFSNKEFDKRWIQSSENMRKKISLYMNELDYISLELNKKGIEILALKNSGIARGIFKKYEACPMGDIDLLIKPENFFEAHKHMIKLGYKLSDRSPFEISSINKAFEHGGAEYICNLSNGEKLWIELQCRSVAGRWIQPHQEPSVEYLLKNSIQIEDSYCRLLSPEDNLLQVCLHTAKHSYVRSPGFRLHTDVDRIVNNYELNWEYFCKKVSQLKVRTPVYLSLLIPKKLLKSNIPDHIINQLNFSPLKHLILQNWLLKVGLFSPEAKKWNRLGYIIFNALLFDSFYDLIKAIFPKSIYLRNNENNKDFLLLIYMKRIHALLFKRSKNI